MDERLWEDAITCGVSVTFVLASKALSTDLENEGGNRCIKSADDFFLLKRMRTT